MPAPSGISVAKANFVEAGAHFSATGNNIISGDQKNAYDDYEPASGPMATDTALNYDLNAVLKGRLAVPRVALASLPATLNPKLESQVRKTMFVKTVLPLVLQVNEQISEDRVRLKKLAALQKKGQHVAALDRLWLAVLSEQYHVKRKNIRAILNHHDVVPPSLALAQAAIESAWGSSRFVREGNAMFGEWTFTDRHLGLVPQSRDKGKTHRIRAFATLYDSIYSYAVNLNKHRAYQEYRAMRTAMRNAGQTLDGLRLATTLHRYSQRGDAYVNDVQTIISSNTLQALDSAELSHEGDHDSAI